MKYKVMKRNMGKDEKGVECLITESVAMFWEVDYAVEYMELMRRINIDSTYFLQVKGDKI